MIRTSNWTSQPWLGVPLDVGNPDSIAYGLKGAWVMSVSGPVNLAAGNYPSTPSGTTKPSLQGSPYGNCLRFDGSTSYLGGVGSVADFNFLVTTAVFTIAARIRLANNAADAAGVILGGTAASASKDVAFYWENRSIVGSPKHFRLRVGNGTGSGLYQLGLDSANNSITDNNWHHVVAVANVSTGAIYIDGAPSTLAASTTSGSPSGPLTAAPDIGRTNSGAIFFNGDIEHLFVWNRVLATDEIIGLCTDPYQVFASTPILPFLTPTGTLLWYLRRMSGGFTEMG